MKKLFLIFCSFLFSFTYSQKNYIFNVEISDRNQAPTFTTNNGVLIYNGTNNAEQIFFSEYKILAFDQTFPDSKWDRTLNIFTFITKNNDFGTNLITDLSSKYLGFEDVTNFIPELISTYPNDYGSTSPNSNAGVPFEISNYDYINVPKAWDYGYGNSKVIIGISDSNINIDDIEFKFKTTLLSGYNDWSYSPPYSMSNESWHGTAVAAIAAAQGNNAHGVAGICSDCNIHATKFGFGNPGSVLNPTPNFNQLLQLAISGAKIINMSWGFYSTSSSSYYQWIFNELHEQPYQVTCIAGTGNNDQLATNPSIPYFYPASYNHVIAVSSVNHWSRLGNFCGVDASITSSTSPFFNVPLCYFVEDMIAPRVAINYLGSGLTVPVTDDPEKLHATNDRVDICAPGHNLFIYPWFDLNNVNISGQPLYYGSGTSMSTPHVSGTIGLMLSVNSCLYPDEVEDVLQLSSKNLEIIQGNEYFIGRIGSGKLETGDAVEFVHEMMINTGNALIDGQDFWRFNFDLKHINNKLTISNQIFRDGNTSNFTAKTAIDVIQNSDFKPNSTGFVDLNIDTTILVCDSIQSRSIDSIEIEKPKVKSKTIKLFPNPNKGIFTIMLSQTDVKDLSVTVFDILGKIVYETISNETVFDITISNLPAGLYLVKLSSNSINETLKFIKE